MINKQLMVSIKSKKKGVTASAIYDGIKRIRKGYANSISKEEAAYVYASKLGIDIYKFLKAEPDLRDRIRQIISSNHALIKPSSPRHSKSKSTVIKVLNIKETQINDPLLPTKILEEAKKMAEVYPLIYVFENSVRNCIRQAMDKAFPSGWWNETRITVEVFRRASSRKQEEGKNLWHGSRSQNMLDYVDLDELEKVISKNTDTLTPYFKGLPKELDWLKIKIKEIYPSRNVIAHCNPLSDHDIKRVQVICRDWQDQLPALKTKLEES